MGGSIKWLANPTAKDLIQQFPLPIALMSGSGGDVILNNQFEKSFGRDAFDSALRRRLKRRSDPSWQTVNLHDRKRGEISVEAQVLRIRGDSMLILNDAADSALLRQLEQLHQRVTELEKRSSTDPLTGLWNRAHLDRVVSAELDRSIKYQQPVSLILLDIDHFKLVNDTYGHRAGDAVLCELAEAIADVVRSIDALFRWGGEEFVVLAASTGYRGAAALAERIRSKVERHHFAGVGPVTISSGVAEHMAPESADVWFNRVDVELYRAKKYGRNRVCVDQQGSSDAWATQSASVIRLVWQEAYECGQPKIDSQHRELFELANVLLDASFKAESEPAALGVALDDLLSHIVRHFADEEELLQRHHYDDFALHQGAHRQLLRRAEALKNAVVAGERTLGNLVDFLANSVVAQHLFKADRDYFPLFAQEPYEATRALALV